MMYLYYGIMGILTIALISTSMFCGWFIAVNGLISDNAWKILDQSSNVECCKRLSRMFQQHVKIMAFRVKYFSKKTPKKDKA